MARKSRTRANHPLPHGGAIAVTLLIGAVVIGFFVFIQVSRNVNDTTGGNPPPSKPNGQPITNTTTSEQWTVAQGLPTNVMRLAFSANNVNLGYASVFINKQEQQIYKTTDQGKTWSSVGMAQGPVSDILATDPLDPQDVVSLSVYAPAPGTYTFQRSLDGGKTWTNVTTSLPTTGEVSQTGWSGSTFLVGFQLDGQLQGSSAVVAFPKNQASVHLDTNGKINGVSIADLTLLTGRRGEIEVWGDGGSSAPTVYGAATKNQGKTWSALPTVIHGKKSIPLAALDDGSVIVAQATDASVVSISNDDGATWTSQPTLPGQSVWTANHSVFVTSHGKTLVVSGNDGTYTLANGVWKKATSKSVIAASSGAAQHTARLWAMDAQGHVIWTDD
jgi:hypothetical protein